MTDRRRIMYAAALLGAGAYLRWAATPVVIAYAIGRKVERIRSWQAGGSTERDQSSSAAGTAAG
jgi:hypothetical protein